MDDPILSVRGLRKSFGQVDVLKGVDLEFHAGRIHAFLGANGAGKSTLLSCIGGALDPDEGEIRLGGERLTALTPRSAIDHGIGLIHQSEQCVAGLTVSENVFLGSEITRHGRVDRRAQTRTTADLLARLEVEIDPSAPVDRLSVGARKIVEIARAIHLSPRVLILDEPTAALGQHEQMALHRVVQTLARQEGLAIVYVTHLLDEVAAIAQDVTVLRDGRVVWTRAVADAGLDDIAQAIAPALTQITRRTLATATDAPALDLNGYCSGFTGPVDLSLREGECLGVYGLLGSGRTDLLEALAGITQPRAGEARYGGALCTFTSPSDALAAGVALVPSDRKEQGLFGALTACENLLMPHFGSKLLPRWRRSGRVENTFWDHAAKRLDIRPARAGLNAAHFSGGNAQKIVLGRWLTPGFDLRLLILDEPTQGIDVGARGDLYDLLNTMMDQGLSLVVASSDPAEITALADRVLILSAGQQVALLDHCPEEATLVAMAHRAPALSPLQHGTTS